jgi:NAD(P)H-dependent flavin oxidoreductase YrpB (nitropropane dioxygenase family)
MPHCASPPATLPAGLPGLPSSAAACNSFTDRWAGKEEELRLVAEELRPAYIQAVADADADKVAVYVGEVIGIMDKLVPAGESIRAMAAQAEALLSGRDAVMAR